MINYKMGCVFLITLIFGICDAKEVFCQQNNKEIGVDSDRLYASYRYKAPGGLLGTFIDFWSNNTYSFETGTDVEQSWSKGIWTRKKDTFYLTSYLKKNDLPVRVNQIADNTLDSLTISWVKDLNGDVIKSATAILNDDDKRLVCMPIFDECKFKKGAIRRIRFEFNDGASSRWLEIDCSSTKIDPVLQVDFPLDLYIYFDHQKYLKKLKCLYKISKHGDLSKPNHCLEKIK